MAAEFFERLRKRFTPEKNVKMEEILYASEWDKLMKTRLDEARSSGNFPRFVTQVGYDYNFITFSQKSEKSLVYFVKCSLSQETGKRAVVLTDGKFAASLICKNDKETDFQNSWEVTSMDEASAIPQQLLNTLKQSGIFRSIREGAWRGGSPQESAVFAAYNSAIGHEA